jgi:hypothetical protein
MQGEILFLVALQLQVEEQEELLPMLLLLVGQAAAVSLPVERKAQLDKVLEAAQVQLQQMALEAEAEALGPSVLISLH